MCVNPQIEENMHKNQHVIRRDDHLWAVRGDGNTRDTSHHPTQKAAMQAAREKLPRNSKVKSWCTESTDRSGRRIPTETIHSRREAE